MKAQKPSKRMKIAMVGMYGGMWREFNPGCLVLGIVTLHELQRRLPEARIDVYAIDNKGTYEGLLPVRKDGILLKFFSRKYQLSLLRNVLPKYDAVIFGGDIIWGGDDVVSDNEIFFASSPKIPSALPKKLLFNAVHTFYTQKEILRQKERFLALCKRASYVSVRTAAIRIRLRKIGARNVKFVPDPALLYEPHIPDRTEREKKILGISLRYKLAKDIAKALPSIDFGGYRVKFMSYSRQYDNRKTVVFIRQKFKGAYEYDEKYRSPLQSFDEIAACDALITDTYHGAIAAAISGIPFICIDVEKERTSRKHQLLSILDLPQRNNIRLSYRDPHNHAILARSISRLLPQITAVKKKRLKNVRLMIQNHFDTMVEIMNNTHTIEEFRKIMEVEFVPKGAKPPEKGSQKEQELFKRWLKGKQILDQNL